MLEKYINQNNQKVYVVVDNEGEWISEVKTYIAHCKNVLCLSHNTINSYCLELNRFIEWLNEQGLILSEVNLDIILKYKKQLKNKNKDIKISTINKSMSIISNFLRYYYNFNNHNSIDANKEFIGSAIKINTNNRLHGIVESQKIFSNLLRDKRVPTKDKEILNSYEIERLIEACSNNRDTLIIKVLLDTGIRIGELMSLTIDCIDIDKSEIHICDIYTDELEHALKTNASNRKVPIPVSTLNMLINYILEQNRYVDSNFIFTKLSGPNIGKPIDYNVIDSMFKRIRKKTDIKRLHPHLIRTTVLTMWKEAGMPKEVLHKLAGHKTLSTTNKYYLKLTPSQRAQALEKVKESRLLYDGR